MKSRDVRMTGRSTRLVDKCIQDLFTNGVVIVFDHYDHSRAHRDLFDRVMRRLYSEHQAYMTTLITVDKPNRTIRYEK